MKVEQALRLDLPYFSNPQTIRAIDEYVKNNPHRPASVLLCLTCPEKEEKLEDLKLLFTVRTDEMPTHAGQISFPGGKKASHETVCDCALRETFEEVGIEKNKLEVLGPMPEFPSLISKFFITPFVSYFQEPLLDETFNFNRDEVQEVFLVKIGDLIGDNVFKVSDKEYKGMPYPLYEFFYEDYRIWGITAHLTANFLNRLGLIKKPLP